MAVASWYVLMSLDMSFALSSSESPFMNVYIISVFMCTESGIRRFSRSNAFI